MLEEKINIIIKLLDYVDYYNKTEKPVSFYRANFENKIFLVRDWKDYAELLKTITSKFERIDEISLDDIYNFAEYIDYLSLSPKREDLFVDRDSLVGYWNNKDGWLTKNNV